MFAACLRCVTNLSCAGELRPGGPRHDNDHVHIQDISVVPTAQELLCGEDPYLPCNRWAPCQSGERSSHLACSSCLPALVVQQGNHTASGVQTSSSSRALWCHCAFTAHESLSPRPGSMPHLEGAPQLACFELFFRLLRHDVVGPVADAVQRFKQAGGLADLYKKEAVRRDRSPGRRLTSDDAHRLTGVSSRLTGRPGSAQEQGPCTCI